MAVAYNKNTLQRVEGDLCEKLGEPFRNRSGQFVEGDWLVNPVLPLCDPKYFKAVEDTIQEMDAGEKSVADFPYQKQEKLSAYSMWYDGLIANGTTVSGFLLPLETEFQTFVATAMIYLDKAKAAGKKTKNSTVKVMDKNHVLHEITLEAFEALVVDYGEYFETLLNNARDKLAAIYAATTKAELDAITFE